jgi:hypothetical protein
MVLLLSDGSVTNHAAYHRQVKSCHCRGTVMVIGEAMGKISKNFLTKEKQNKTNKPNKVV